MENNIRCAKKGKCYWEADSGSCPEKPWENCVNFKMSMEDYGGDNDK